jgi:hypothetical protein
MGLLPSLCPRHEPVTRRAPRTPAGGLPPFPLQNPCRRCAVWAAAGSPRSKRVSCRLSILIIRRVTRHERTPNIHVSVVSA